MSSEEDSTSGMLSIGTYTRKREDLQKNKKNGVLDDKGPIYVIVGVGIGPMEGT